MIAPWMLTGPYTVFDVETTGMSPVHNRIIEIGAVRIEHDGSTSTFQTLIHPETTISYQITRLTGITNEMVANAPIFAEIGGEFLDFIAGSKLVAHNARFDLAFLMESLSRTPDLPLWEHGAYDTLMLSRKAFPGLPSYSLQNLKHALQLGENVDGTAHRALYDAEITMELFHKVMHQLHQFGETRLSANI